MAELRRKLRLALPEDLAVTASASPRRGSTPASLRSGGATPIASGRRLPSDPLHRLDTDLIRRPLDVERVNDAAQTLLGLRDFAAFCRAGRGATTIRTLLAAR